MDMFQPSDADFQDRKSDFKLENDDNSPSKRTSQVLGPELAKKRLLAFAQQWNKTKDIVPTKDIPSPPKVHPSSHSSRNGDLKYTFIAEGVDRNEKSYPLHIVKYTRTKPSLSYCVNPHHATGLFKTRKQMWDTSDEATKIAMSFITSGRRTHVDPPPFLGRSRK